jgi:hypothetical protein
MAELAHLIQEFAELLTPAIGNDTKLTEWITTIRGCDLPHPGVRRARSFNDYARRA